MNKFLYCLFACLFPFCSIASEIQVQCQIRSADQPMWVGQRITLLVEAYIDEGWVGIKQINMGEVEDLLILDRNPSGTTMNKKINGASCSGQQKEVALYALRAGSFRIPAFTLQLETRSWGANAKTEQVERTVGPIDFNVTLPAGMAPGGNAVSTRALKASQEWSLDAEECAVGEAIERTVRMEADAVPGMLFPVMPQFEHEGIGVYSKQPLVQDKVDRGQLTGLREQTVTYVFEAAGIFILPDLQLQWFDLSSQEMKLETFPGRMVTVTGMIASSETKGRSIWIWFVGTLGVGCGFYVLRKWLYTGYINFQESEWMSFRQVRLAARSGDGIQMLNAVLEWGNLIQAGFRQDLFFKQVGDEESLDVLAKFYEAISRRKEVPTMNLLKKLKAARKVYHNRKKLERYEPSILPPLNP